MKKSWLLIGGGLFAALIVAAIVVVLAVDAKEASYAADTPQGVVQNYLRALRDNDTDKARSYIDPAALVQCTNTDYLNRFEIDNLRDSTVTLRRSKVAGGMATIDVEIRHNQSDVFDSGYGYSQDFTLVRRSDQWLLKGSFSNALPWPMYNCRVRPPL